MIGHKYGVWYGRNWVGKLLVRWGFSWQKAEKRPLEQKAEKTDDWLEAELPVLEKKINEGGTVVWAYVKRHHLAHFCFKKSLAKNFLPSVTRQIAWT